MVLQIWYRNPGEIFADTNKSALSKTCDLTGKAFSFPGSQRPCFPFRLGSFKAWGAPVGRGDGHSFGCSSAKKQAQTDNRTASWGGILQKETHTLSHLLLTHGADGVREKAKPDLAGVAGNVAASASGSLPVLNLLIFLIGSLCVFPKNPEGGDESKGTIYARQVAHNQAPGTTRHDLNYIARG